MIFYAKNVGGLLEFSNKRALFDWLLSHGDYKGSYIANIEKEKGIRTLTQNNALHKGFDLVAETLNNAGLDMKKVLKPEVDIPWTTESVKKYLFKPIQKIMTGKESTTELNKVSEIDETWEVMMRHLMEKHHIDYIPFPKKEKEEFEVSIAYPESIGKPLI